MKLSFLVLMILLTLLALAACGDTDSPEAQIRAFIADAETLAEERNARGLRNMISETYRDEQSTTKDQLERLIRVYIFRNRELYLLTRIQSIDVIAPDAAKAEVAVGIAGQPIPEEQDIRGPLDADLLYFELDLIKPGDEWQVQQVQWRRADWREFF